MRSVRVLAVTAAGAATFSGHNPPNSVDFQKSGITGLPVPAPAGDVSGPHLHYEQRLTWTVRKAVLDGRG